MKKLTMLMVLLLLGGCQQGGSAATAASLLAYDAIIAANTEAMKGVVAYDDAVRGDIERSQTEMLHRLKATLRAAYLEQKGAKVTNAAYAMASEKAANDIVFAGSDSGKVVALQAHLKNFREWERRRAGWYDVTMDNLTYAIDVAHDAKMFEMYRANVEEQWRAYLMAQARSRLTKMPAAPARKVD